MFSWLSKLRGNPAAAPARSTLDFTAIRNLEKAVLFKHSRSCPVSWMASRQVHQFQEANPSVPVYTVTVQEDRALSAQIAAETGIQHESPQVIILRNGKVVATASHEGVTEGYLTSSIA